MDDAKAALLGHRNGGFRLGHRIHSGADERYVQLDPLRQSGRNVDVSR